MLTAGNETARAAVRPAVLLPDTDEVVRVRRIDVDPRLDLAVQVRPIPDCAGIGRAAGERARTGDLDEWTGHEVRCGDADSSDEREKHRR